MRHLISKCIIFLIGCNDLYNAAKFPFVFVYPMNEKGCEKGYPIYIIDVLIHAYNSQNPMSCDIVLLSNFAECHKFQKRNKRINQKLYKFQDGSWRTFPHTSTLIDTADIVSNRTLEYIKLSETLFRHHTDPGFKPGLWSTSAQRFFYMEDYMMKNTISELLHVEMDNLIYGDFLQETLPYLRRIYPHNIALTPLTSKFTTASVLWIPNLYAIHNLTTFLYDLSKGYRYTMPTENDTLFMQDFLWINYTNWLKEERSSIKPTSLFMASRGHSGLKLAAVNEMSMLAYYIHMHGSHLNLPILPPGVPSDFKFHRYTLNMINNTYQYNNNNNSSNANQYYDMNNNNIEPCIWDSNSWGMFLDGDYFKKTPGFIDGTHIIGQAIRALNCTVMRLCVGPRNDTILSYCHTAPYVNCQNTNPSNWIKLCNLHVHTKLPARSVSKPCTCTPE